MARALLLSLAVGLPGLALCDIDYQVTARHGEDLHVTMTIPVKGSETLVQSPRWAPGAYALANNARRIKGLRAGNDAGNSIAIQSVDDMTWKCPNPAGSKFVVLHYDVTANDVDNTVHYSGPATYLYVVGRKTEKCVLNLDVPTDWKVAIGLDPYGTAAHQYSAPTYDVLADTPVTTGDFILDTYYVDGKPHLIALRGKPKAEVDRAYLTKACKFISEMDDRFFRGLPYKRYVWHFAVNDNKDGAGGLEHLNGTEITLAKGLGPRAVGVLSHEYFHLWNVKRIRSKVLGPFDYTQLPQTGALWWLEGVTDYYAHSLLRRNGWSDDEQYFGTLATNLRNQRSRPGRLQISPYDSSYKVREANGGVGNSNGLLVSYYDTGWLLGMCLDIEILTQTHGKRSLDDVERALWRECRNNRPGFGEDEIRNLAVKIGGQALGPYYDEHVMKPGDLPIEDELAKVGLTAGSHAEQTVEAGFTAAGRRGEPFAVVTVVAGSALMVGDVVQSIGGVSLKGLSGPDVNAAYQRGLATAAVGQPLSLSVVRGDMAMDLTVTPTAGSRTVFDVKPNPAASPDELALRKEWLSAVRG